MTRAHLKALVLALLEMAVDAQLEGDTPDLLLAPGAVSRAQAGRLEQLPAARADRAVYIAELECAYAARAAAEQDEHADRRRELVFDLAVELQARSLAVPLYSTALPEDVRRWARQQLKTDPSTLSRVYVYLTVRDAIDFELAYSAPLPGDDAQWLYADPTRTVDSRENREDRTISYWTDEGAHVVVSKISDAPSTGLDVRGWERATSYSRRAGAPERAPDAVPKYQPKRVTFVDAKGVQFVLTERGWTFNETKVATSVAQRLDRRVTKRHLRPVVAA